MAKEKDDFSRDMEDIFRKTIEINKQYLKHGTDLFKDFGTSGRELKNFNVLQPDVMMGAFTSFTKMNLDHYKNMMDLGFAITKKAFNPSAENSSGEADGNHEEPSFILSATTHAGKSVDLQFLLDNIKNEEVLCQLVNSEFVNEADSQISLNLPTTFKPQSFNLAPGISKRVDIHIAVNDDLRLGTYQSSVQVQGFEPAYFLIKLTIEEESAQTPIANPPKNSGNGRQQKQKPRKK
ncbi:hypothetical protein QRD02_08685 [Aequorivita sp. SDUM287046]|uniref:Uncharacterized protein n=1 Tax=Aequorivita aurantiaca TaxID=3053356 RepID=A0ABT8DGQ9_9FLAO|nr:hypothetical protein [Aequorivita aurantiaca]MDN3724458.1 hypothetical protein [Aequorivita aurantiaca]